MKKFILIFSIVLTGAASSAAPVFVGYLYPSGGARGSIVRVVVGGQGFGGNVTILTDTPGVKLKSAVKVPYMGYFHSGQRKYLTQYLKNIYAGKMEKPPMPEKNENEIWRKHQWLEELDKLPMLERSIVAHSLFVRANALQEAPSISNRLILELEIAPDTPVGSCRLRIVSGKNISNEKLFFIDSAHEIMEQPYYPPFAQRPENEAVAKFPAIINGQIMPGETDIFKVTLQAGQNYTFAMRAAELSPFLGDAVPGHFQPILTLRNSRGQEVAFADDEYHHPDPVLRFTAQESGTYTLHVSDSIKRGRADFVYRIKAFEGNISFVPYPNYSGIVPMPQNYTAKNVPAVINPGVRKNGMDIKGVLATPAGISFKVRAPKGERVIFELFAARLDSPLDGVLTIRDPSGKIIAQNDDCPQSFDLDLCRRQVDPLLDVTFPADGVYTLQLQSRNTFNGDDHFYTLQIRPPCPGVIAVSGTSVLALNRQGVGKMRFYIHRKDGFAGEVKITSPMLTPIGNPVIPAGQNSGECTFFLTNAPKKNQIIQLEINAEYVVDGKKYTIPVIPAEEAMQAFAYTHLVVAKNFYCFTLRPAAYLLKKPQEKKAPVSQKNQ